MSPPLLFLTLYVVGLSVSSLLVRRETKSTNGISTFFALLRDARGRRYTHSREYLEAVCRDSGFRVLVCSEMVLRKNAGAPVRGFIFVTEAVLL